jgi:hypothetical protein
VYRAQPSDGGDETCVAGSWAVFDSLMEGDVMTERQRRWGIAGLFLLALVVVLLIVLSPWDAPPPAPPEHNTAKTNGPAPQPPDPPKDYPNPHPTESVEPATTPTSEPADVEQPQPTQPGRFELRVDLAIPTYDIPGVAGYRTLATGQSLIGGRLPRHSNLVAVGEGATSLRHPPLNLSSPEAEGPNLVFHDAVRIETRSEGAPDTDYAFCLVAFLQPLAADGSAIAGLVVVAAAYHEVTADQIREDMGRIRIQSFQPRSELEIQVPAWAASSMLTVSTFWPAFSREYRSRHSDRLTRDTWPQQVGVSVLERESSQELPGFLDDMPDLMFRSSCDEIGRLRVFGLPDGTALETELLIDGHGLTLTRELWDQTYEFGGRAFIPVSSSWRFAFGAINRLGLPDVELVASPPLTAEERTGLLVNCLTKERGGLTVLARASFDERLPVGLWQTQHNLSGQIGSLPVERDVEFVAVGLGFQVTSVKVRLGEVDRVTIHLTRLAGDEYGLDIRMAEAASLPLPVRFTTFPKDRSVTGYWHRDHAAVLAPGEVLSLRDVPGGPDIANIHRTLTLDHSRLDNILSEILEERFGFQWPFMPRGLIGTWHNAGEGSLVTRAEQPDGTSVLNVRPAIMCNMLAPKDGVRGADIQFTHSAGTVVPTSASITKIDYFSGELSVFLERYDLYQAYIDKLYAQ